MRALKRWWRRRRAFRAAQPQLEICRPHAERLFGGPVTWKQGGGCGRDVVCLAVCGSRPAGVVRVALSAELPGGPRKRDGLPFVPLAAEAKIEREWRAYSVGWERGLTPRPLWRSDHALLCAYVDGEPLKREADQGLVPYLTLATRALPDIARLHQAGLTHMDMSLSNILRDREGRSRFVDFEYEAAEGITVEQQCLYDYLRLLESIWKYLTPAERRSVNGTWGAAFRACAPASVRGADLAPLRAGLGRILAAEELAELAAGR